MRFRRLIAVLSFILTCATPSFAERLPADVRPDHYDLAFDVDLAAARFGGTETIRVRLDRPARRTVLHALDIQFHEVTIRHRSITQKATVTLSRALEQAIERINACIQLKEKQGPALARWLTTVLIVLLPRPCLDC